MVETKQVHQGGMEVMHVDPVTDDIETKIIRLAERQAELNATARHPHGKGLWMMVTAK